MRPPFEITSAASALLAEIERGLGRHEGALTVSAPPQLRRSSRVKTIHGSVSIEGNTLTEKQITAVLEGKRVIAPERDLLEVKNAIACYELMPGWRSGSTVDFLAAHKKMMGGLVDNPGRWRSQGVGITKGDVIAHVPPPADRVAGLMNSLMGWAKKERQLPAPILGAVVHYEIEFIHPFLDGNGRMGRLWHSLILLNYHPLFALVPIESVIKSRQSDYYQVLGECDKEGKSTRFIEFALEVTLEALTEVNRPAPRMTGGERIELARDVFGTSWFSRKEYHGRYPGISTATASRDLRQAVAKGTLVSVGERALMRYQFS